MNNLFSQRLLVGVVSTAAIISQAIIAKQVNVTTKANKCKDRDAVKEVNITFTPSNISDCKYSFGCGKHESDYPACPSSQQKPQSVMSAEHRNDTCPSSYGGGGRLARSARDGRCYRICNSCNRELVIGSEAVPDAEGAKSHAADKSQSKQTCIEEKHTVENIIEHSKRSVSNEGCKWKYKCKKKENSTNYVEKAVGMRLRPTNGSRIRVQLYCCKMNCSYNCTMDSFGSMESETITSKLNDSEVFTAIQVQIYGKKDGLPIYTVVFNKCNECPPGLVPPKDPPPEIPVPVLAIGYGDGPKPYKRCQLRSNDCPEGEHCFLYCYPTCSSDEDCDPPANTCLGGRHCYCRAAGTDCESGDDCCSGKCIQRKCVRGDGHCTYDANCHGSSDENGNEVRLGVCVKGQCTQAA